MSQIILNPLCHADCIREMHLFITTANFTDNSTTNSSMSLRVRQPSDDTQGFMLNSSTQSKQSCHNNYHSLCNYTAGISQACPVCGSFIKPSELEHHCSVELERLREMTQSRFGSSRYTVCKLFLCLPMSMSVCLSVCLSDSVCLSV